MSEENTPATAAALLAAAGWKNQLSLSEAEREQMVQGHALLTEAVQVRPVYGVTQGFGPLADHTADPDPKRQGMGLIDHLTVGQGRPLPPDVTRLMVWIRLRGMTHGHSGVEPGIWDQLAAQWNAGFTPVVPEDGSLSASGDLVPLAHAAQAATGNGRAWTRSDDGTWRQLPARDDQERLGLTPVHWEARSALAFVNGTSASLARGLVNHVRLAALAHAATAVTGRLAALLGCDPAPFGPELAEVRGHPGHRTAAALIGREFPDGARRNPARPFQEPYSLRCAPQVIGAVLDQLRLQETILVTEALGCTDNPVLVNGELHHGGNFHAAPVALASEQHTVCIHQLAYLMERQLALALDPHRNGGLPMLLAHEPGRTSGLAGVQIAATSHLAAIRQRAYPASCTPVPSNLDNQDHVPLALNGTNAVADALDRAWWIVASAHHALAAIHRLQGRPDESGRWGRLLTDVPVLTTDRPLAEETADLAARLEFEYSHPEDPFESEEWAP
ncbi:aromatic amino acid ammonia-lyase [Lipingzhangella sp. LS1_29]|uniref:Aromatic amino acid ammonia-lyase n=1 Tax=Lipingzhangella rawalii TaxID=2055835 RepID=A0ABU2H940_9ACTN|nr:aromatic amino acid ammonia-lyase [Lipingzhangella rawalii]MDS1271517.1 aromatic amino acid ammonia-lyase [Lipingzhangella rawalii]